MAGRSLDARIYQSAISIYVEKRSHTLRELLRIWIRTARIIVLDRLSSFLLWPVNYSFSFLSLLSLRPPSDLTAWSVRHFSHARGSAAHQLEDDRRGPRLMTIGGGGSSWVTENSPHV